MIQNALRSTSRPGLPALAITILALAGCGTATRQPEESPSCLGCHGGDSGNAAPPRTVTGETATTAIGVGAHQAHLTRSTFAAPVACGDCHVVPTTAEGHVDGVAEVRFSTRAGNGAGLTGWNPVAATCSNVYCHAGNGRQGGSFTTPVWNAAGQGHLDCGSCHGFPPPGHGPNATTCRDCHPATVRVDGTIDVAGGKHLDGQVEAEAGACDGCHGAPPATGAHRAHVGLGAVGALAYGQEWRTEDLDPTGASGVYTFGCGTCHPKDPAKHRDGFVEVELSAAAGEAGGLRAMNGAGAAYAGGSCSNVYCHSSGQASPTFVTTPGWTSGAALGCGGCHGNPPAYPNGGPDGDANSHLFLAFNGREAGHFTGLQGPTFHRSRHGKPAAFATEEHAAPMTCQACHAETVDPANTAPGGFFYLDTTITTRLPGGDPARLTTAAWLDTQCTSCHDGAAGSPPAGAGKVRPLRHVNGRRDVIFDARGTADLPADFYAFLGAGAPTRPYFMTNAAFFTAYALPPDAGWDPAPPAAGARATLSFELSAATWAPATKTCSSVACHLGNAVRWGQKDYETTSPTCTGCHGIQ